MTIKECYEQMGADYEDVLGRLRNEALIRKFAKKFLEDGSFQMLKDGLAKKDGEMAFRAAHTLNLIIYMSQALILQRSLEAEIQRAVRSFLQK